MPPSFAERPSIWRVLLRRGLTALLRRGLRPVVSWKTLWFFERDLTRLTVRAAAARIPLEVRHAQREDLAELEALARRAGGEWETLAARLARDQCLVGLSAGRLVHASWRATTSASVPEIPATLHLGPGEVYLYDSLTDPAVRGQGVQPAVVSVALREEQAQGYRRHLYYMQADNLSGLPVLRKVAEGAPTRTRIVRCIRFTGLSGILVTGLQGPGRPTLELQKGVRARRLGRWGYWVRARPP